MTPRYRSESRLLLEVRENVFMRAEADKNGADRNTIDPEAVTSQIQVVLSRDLAREVIKKENSTSSRNSILDRRQSLLKSILGLFGVGRDPSTLTPEERTLESYYDRLNVYAIEKSRVIAIDFYSANPELAARVANTVAETYLSMQQSAKQDQTRAAGDWLAVEIDKMRTKVADAEAKVEEYRAKSNLFVGSNNTSLPNQQLTEINSQIAAARGQKADLEARARQLRDSGALRQVDRVLRHRQFRIRCAAWSNSASRCARNWPNSPRRCSTSIRASRNCSAQIGEVDRQIAHRRRAAGAPARQRRQGRRRPAGDADRQPRHGQEARLAEQRAGRAIARARTRGQDRSAICSNPIWRNIAKPRRATTSTPRRRRRASFRAPRPAIKPDLSEETADRADRGLRRLRAVGGLHRDRRAAGVARAVVLWLRLCAGRLCRAELTPRPS